MVNKPGIGQVQASHDDLELFQSLTLTQPGIALFLLPNRRNATLFVVMRGIDQRIVRQGKQFAPHAFKQGIGIAVLEVCAPAPFNQQCITRKEPITEQVGKMSVCVTWRMQRRISSCAVRGR